MAQVDTGSGGCWLSTIKELVMQFRMKVCEEMDAANSYDRLIDSVRQMGFSVFDEQGKARELPEGRISIDDANEIVKILEKIRDDEIGHSAAFLALIEGLDPKIEAIMRKGIDAA
jgi:hypothetical protein